LDLARADVDPVLARGHRAGEAAVDGVVAEQVGVGLDRPQVVDRHHLDVLAAMLDDRAQDEAADAAETVDGDADGHGGGLLEAGLWAGASMEPRARGFKPAAVTSRDRLQRLSSE